MGPPQFHAKSVLQNIELVSVAAGKYQSLYPFMLKAFILAIRGYVYVLAAGASGL
jgi:hypothetical protein